MTDLSNDRYQVLRKLGEGGMATVYLARDRKLDCEVVVKMPHRGAIEEAGFSERFAREIRSLVQLVHPHVVKIQDVDSTEGVPFYVMQYLAGGSLHDQAMPADPATLKKWLLSVAAALDFVHKQGFLHRDIKPANILFDIHDNAYISDFGVAKVLSAKTAVKGATQLTGEGLVVGTVGFVAPELILGEQKVDGRADQYALAVTVFQVLSGRLPFDAATPSALLVQQAVGTAPPLHQVAPSVPRPISDAVKRALCKEPQRRYPTCLAFAQAVLSAKAPPAPPRPAQPAPKEPLPRPTSAAPRRSGTTHKTSPAAHPTTSASHSGTAPHRAPAPATSRQPAHATVKSAPKSLSAEREKRPSGKRSVLMAGLLIAAGIGLAAGGFFVVRDRHPAAASTSTAAAAAPTFVVNPPNDVSVQPGKSVQVSISIVRQGYEGVVRLNPETQPPGVHLHKAEIKPGESSTNLLIDVDANISGTIPIKVNAVAEGIEQSTTVSIRILPSPELRLVIPPNLPDVQLGASSVSIRIEVIRIQCADQVVRVRVDKPKSLEGVILVVLSSDELKPGKTHFTIRIQAGDRAMPGAMVSLPVRVSAQLSEKKLEKSETLQLRIAARGKAK